MITKILSTQIVIFWETIKHCTVRADEVDRKDLQPYLNELLRALLNDKAQCWVRLDENRVLMAMMITRINIDKVTGEKYLHLQGLYSFQVVSDDIWKKDIVFIRKFAEKESCSYISFNSRHKKVWELGKTLGFQEKHRVFNFRLKETSP